MKRLTSLTRKKRSRSLRSLGLAPLLVEINEARRPHTCSRLCAFQEKKNRKKRKQKKPAPPKTHHDIHISPATATTSRQRATKHVPRISPYSPASIDPEFVEIGLVQLSQSVKTTNVTCTYRLMEPGTHPGMKTFFCLKAKNDLGRFAPSALPHSEEAFSP